MRKAKLHRNTSPTRAALLQEIRSVAQEAGALWLRPILQAAGVTSCGELNDVQIIAGLIGRPAR